RGAGRSFSRIAQAGVVWLVTPQCLGTRGVLLAPGSLRGRPVVGETQVTQIWTHETCLAVFAVLRPTPPPRGASVSADGLGLHARCGRWPPLLVWRPLRLADRCGGRRLLGSWRVASRALWRARARRPC